MGSYYQFNPHDPRRLPAYAPPQPAAQGTTLLKLGFCALAIYALVELADSDKQTQRLCGLCGGAGHDRRTCPHDGERAKFPRSIPKSRSCQCCGSSRYGIQRHHTRGRSSLSDFLDVCGDCHLECCHDGHFQNIGKKPQVCCISGRRSVWRA